MLRKAVNLSLIGLTVGLFSVTALAANHNSGIGELAANKIWSVNVIAYDKCPKNDNAQRIAVLADFTDIIVPDGEITLVDIDKRNKIFLQPGADFRVIDSNGCDGNGALLQLEGTDGVSVTYEVWVRLVGKPAGEIDVQLCATDGGIIVCDTDKLTKVRYTGKGEPSFTNATNALLKFGNETLFSNVYENYFWGWNTIGKPHAQVWFVDP